MPCHMRFTAVLISIHAPRTGSDRHCNPADAPQPDFNPRSPHGERPKLMGAPDDVVRISIHAPRTGSDSVASDVFLL